MILIGATKGAFARVAPAGHALVGCKLPCLRPWLASEPGSREPKMTSRPGLFGAGLAAARCALAWAPRSDSCHLPSPALPLAPSSPSPPPAMNGIAPGFISPVRDASSSADARGRVPLSGEIHPGRWPLFLRRHSQVRSCATSPLVGGRVVHRLRATSPPAGGRAVCHSRGGRRQGKWLADGHRQGKLERGHGGSWAAPPTGSQRHRPWLDAELRRVAATSAGSGAGSTLPKQEASPLVVDNDLQRL
jgi:hypothetical protein